MINLGNKFWAYIYDLIFIFYSTVTPSFFLKNDSKAPKQSLSFKFYADVINSYVNTLGHLRRNPAVVEEFQKRRLQRMVLSAEKTQWWRSYFDKCGIIPSHIQTELDLQRIPPVNRTHLTAVEQRDLLSYEPKPFKIQVNKTSGSTTGTPFSVFFEKTIAVIDVAGHYMRTLKDFGFDFSEYTEKNFFFHFNIFGGVQKLTTAPEQFGTPISLKPHEDPVVKVKDILKLMGNDEIILFTHPSELPIFLQTMETLGARPHIRACMVIGQVMEKSLRIYTEKILGCPVVSVYGFRERMITATSCKDNPDLLHTHPERSIIEILDDEGKLVPSGVYGQITITALDNTLQPLIRYQPGDIGRIHTGIECSCINKGSLLEIESRSADYFIFSDGTQKPAQKFLKFFGSEMSLAHVQRVQVRQEKIDLVKVLIVPKEKSSSDFYIEKIEERIRSKNFFPSDVVLFFEKVSKIDDGNAKYKSFIALPDKRT